VAPTVATRVLPETMPLTVFLGDGFHTRVRDGRVLLLLPDEPADPETLCFDDGWLPEVTARAHRRIPALRGVPVDRDGCWCGLYEMSPDKHVLLGAAPGVENLYLANGSSGHGVMHSPALGQLVAEMILDGRAHTIDVGELGPERFAADGPPPRPALL
jgi:sarcosine oxidase subunit beta